MNEVILDSYDHHYLVEDLSKSLYTCTNNNAHYIFHADYFAEPFIPYQIKIAAATKIGKGDVVVKTVFTVESGNNNNRKLHDAVRLDIVVTN